MLTYLVCGSEMYSWTITNQQCRADLCTCWWCVAPPGGPRSFIRAVMICWHDYSVYLKGNSWHTHKSSVSRQFFLLSFSTAVSVFVWPTFCMLPPTPLNVYYSCYKCRDHPIFSWNLSFSSKDCCSSLQKWRKRYISIRFICKCIYRIFVLNTIRHIKSHCNMEDT